MKTKHNLIAFLGLVSAASLFAAGSEKPASRVDVTFHEPEKFTDVKEDFMDTERGRDHYLGILKKHFESTAPRYLAAGERLEVKLTNVDLAGDFEPWRGVNFDHIRIIKDMYPPRIELEFRLVGADGKVVSEGKRRLQELGYTMTASMPASDVLRYDKDMITEWLRREFKRPS